MDNNEACKVPDMEYLESFIKLTEHLPDDEFIGRLGVETENPLGWHNLPIRLEHIRVLMNKVKENEREKQNV